MTEFEDNKTVAIVRTSRGRFAIIVKDYQTTEVAKVVESTPEEQQEVYGDWRRAQP